MKTLSREGWAKCKYAGYMHYIDAEGKSLCGIIFRGYQLVPTWDTKSVKTCPNCLRKKVRLDEAAARPPV